ncbi:MAG: ATP-dependent DNA helicase RecG [Candidatus Omnitrophota bacterium]
MLKSVPIRYIKGIGPQRAKLLDKMGIQDLEGLLYYFPRRYEDRSNFISISKLQEGQTYTIKVRVLAKGARRSFRRRGFSITEIAVGDQTGRISCVWFNQPYLKDYFNIGSTLILYGKVERWGSRLQMNSPEFEIVSQDPDEPVSSPEKSESLNIGRIVPVYSLAEGITQRNFRKLVKSGLDEYLPKIKDFLPYGMRSRRNLLNLALSLINIHFPEDPGAQKRAYERLVFEEFFFLQLPLVLRKLKKEERPGISHQVEGALVDNFISSLPFKLTASQQNVLTEIKSDMSKPHPMQRLLQGDVGSGKTVVAVIASLMAVQGGYQAVFMAPTEILARQHFQKINSWLMSLGSGQKEVKTALLTGSLDKKEKSKACQGIKEGEIDLIIGTHALLEEEVRFKKLGLVVIDEQHKFGVGQRALLPEKGTNPDILIMTATPIPRTLAITLYGDLDFSVIRELPPGRGTVKTFVFTKKEESRAYDIARAQVKQGNQVYIVYPVIEESYALDIAGAKKMYNEFKKQEFKDFRLGLIHGRLKQSEQEEIMSKFKEKELDILVATTVLEVGIDIPASTCMIVQHAERFGLAQLHQLRGRIGRGKEESFCVLISDAETQEASARLEAMARYNDGFQIAEEDLKLRGPGEFFGVRQHGLTGLKLANPLTQMQILKIAREEAIGLLNLDPRLEARPNSLLKEKLLQRFPEYEKLMLVG